MSEVTEFTILQLKSQLEASLEQYGSQHRESLKLLLQYSKLLGTYAESQSNNKAVAILNQAFKLLLPEKPPKILTIQFQYWRLLLVTAIKLSKALEINGQLQQGLNVLIQIENLYKKHHTSLEWAQNVELEYLYYHLALLWEKQQNLEQTYYAANECILLLKSNLKNKSEPKQIHMLSEMLRLQSETKTQPQQQLPFYNQILTYQSKYLGESSKETIKTAMKINQLKGQIQFEKEIDEFNKDDFQKKQPIQEVSQVDFYGEEKSINLDQGTQIKPFDTKEFLRQKLFHQPKRILIKNSNTSQSKTSLKISHQSKKSAEDLKRYTDSRINLKINSRTSSQGENKFFYFVNSLQNRTKTETTQLKTNVSKHLDRLTPSQAILIRCKTNKSNISLNSAQTNLQQEKPTFDENLKNLMTQRPSSSLAYQRLAKQLQVAVTNNHPPQQKIIKRINTQDLFMKKKNQSQQVLVLPTELSTKKSNQAQEIQFAILSQKSIRAEEVIKRSERELYELHLDKIIAIQRFFRARQQQKKPIKINLNKFSLRQLPEDEQLDKTPAAKSKGKDLKHGYQRSNTSSVESLRNKREFHLLPSKQKDHSFHSQASSKFINIKSGSNSQIVEQSSESLIIISDNWVEEISGECCFFCSDQADSILRLKCLKATCLKQDEENCSLKVEITIESQFKTHLLKLPLEMSTESLRGICKFQGIQFFQHLITELITIYYELIPHITYVLIYMGSELVTALESVISNLSILMTHTSAQRRLNGLKLIYNKDIHIKSNRKMIKQFYSKQRQEQRQQYFKAHQYFGDHYNIKVKASQSEQNFISDFETPLKNRSSQNQIQFNFQTKQVSPLKPPAIPLMLFEDSEEGTPILEVSIRDPDVNRIQLKNIINPQKHRPSISENEMNRFSNIFQQHQKVHHQRNLSNNSQKQVGESLFKKTFTLESNPIQNKILIKNQQIDESFSNKSPSLSISETKVNACDLLPPSVAQSYQGFHKKNVGSAPSDNLLDTQQLLVANQLFDTQALEVLELIPEQENELEQKIVTIYKKDDHFTVSPEWKKKRKRTMQNLQMEYFWNQHKAEEKKVFQKIYNNPFYKNEQLLAGTLKIDKQFFIVQINQILKDNLELFNQSSLNKRELVKIQIIFRLANHQWEDSVFIKFKEFIKWFVPDFELSEYVRLFGLSKQQKIQALQNLSRYAHIKESKLKLEYFEERKQKAETQNRRAIEMQRMIAIENLISREKLNEKYIEHLGLTNLFQELLNERKCREDKRKKKDERYRVFLQLTNPNSLNSETLGPKYIGLDYDGESEEKTLQVPSELQHQVLKSFNTIIHLRAQTQIVRIGQAYLIWHGSLIKLWRPFQRKIWQWVKVENKEKLINALQCTLRDYLMKQILSKTLALNGQKFVFKQKQEILVQTQNQQKLYQYLQQSQFTNFEFYNFLSLLRCELLQDQNNPLFWNTYFKQYKQLQHSIVNSYGDCLLEITIYIDNFNKILSQQNSLSYTLIRVNIFEKKNMKTRMHKLALTLEDLQITSQKQLNSIQDIFDGTQRMMNKFIQYELLGVNRHPTLTIKNVKQNGIIKLVNQLPWIEKFNYDDFKITLYPQKMNFYHVQVKSPKVICKVIRFINFPSLIRNHYDSYNGAIFQEPKFRRVPAIITIEKCSEIQCFYIYIYFPQNSKRFMSKLHFDDIQFETDSNLKLNYQLKEQLRIHRSDKQWQKLISQFKVSFNQQRKLILCIEKFKNIQCVLQEVIYQKIRQVQNDVIMFIVNIEQRHDYDPDYIHVSNPLMKISEAKNFIMFLKLQWLTVQDKIQSYRLPLYELMIGYYEKIINKVAVFDYKFKLAELIHMCQISIENVIMNFSQQDLYNNTLEYLMPQQLTYNLHQRMKLNIKLKTIQVDKSIYQLLYRGLLLKQPQIIVAIYQKMNKKKLYFYIQRMTDGECFIHKIRFQELENIYPGFVANLKSNQRAVGPNVFKILKNRLIVQSYYQLN